MSSTSGEDTFLESFVESISTLPNEIRRNLELMKELDLSSIQIIDQLRTYEDNYILRAKDKLNSLSMDTYHNYTKRQRIIRNDNHNNDDNDDNDNDNDNDDDNNNSTSTTSSTTNTDPSPPINTTAAATTNTLTTSDDTMKDTTSSVSNMSNDQEATTTMITITKNDTTASTPTDATKEKSTESINNDNETTTTTTTASEAKELKLDDALEKPEQTKESNDDPKKETNLSFDDNDDSNNKIPSQNESTTEEEKNQQQMKQPQPQPQPHQREEPSSSTKIITAATTTEEKENKEQPNNQNNTEERTVKEEEEEANKNKEDDNDIIQRDRNDTIRNGNELGVIVKTPTTTNIDEHVFIVPTTEEFRKLIEDADALTKIAAYRRDARQQVEEKVTIAEQTYAIVDSACKRLDSDLEKFETLLKGMGAFEAAAGAQPDDLAAIQVIPNSPDWILAKVITHDPKTGMFMLSDEDVESNKTFNLPEVQVVILGTGGVDRLARGDIIYAVYPDTTSFYQATVVQGPRKVPGGESFVMVNFKDDGDENGITHDKAVPMQHVMRVPYGAIQ